LKSDAVTSTGRILKELAEEIIAAESEAKEASGKTETKADVHG
jgi:hypothetical protein